MTSRRFPGKPLANIMGKPMIQHVYEAALKCRELDQIIIATDSTEIEAEAKKFQAEICKTHSNHETGLDRLIEAKNQMELFDLYVNIQGDEPLIQSETITGVIQVLKKNPHHMIASSATIFANYQDFLNPNYVKVVVNHQNLALYFSRSPIPYSKDKNVVPEGALKHQGLYAYTKEALNKIIKLDITSIEKTETLEQLRLLYFGMSICIHQTPYDSIGVDHPEDIKKVENIFQKQNI